MDGGLAQEMPAAPLPPAVQPLRPNGAAKSMVLPVRSSAAPGKGKEPQPQTGIRVGGATMVVHTKNCIPHAGIISQVRSAESLPWVKWLPMCRPHDRKAVIVSGGHSWTDHLDDIRRKGATGDLIICVKSTHNWLLDAGIVPFACSLLDPRPLVADFVKPHPAVRYLVASMCHDDVWKLLQGKRVFGYHAGVGASEQSVLTKGIVVGGGSCAATRAIRVLYAVGFRKFDLYGFDSCYREEPPKVEGYQSAHVNKDRINVQIAGKSFLTDPELVAQVQDYEQAFGQLKDCQFQVFGDGAVKAAHDFWAAVKVKQDAEQLRDFVEVLA